MKTLNFIADLLTVHNDKNWLENICKATGIIQNNEYDVFNDKNNRIVIPNINTKILECQRGYFNNCSIITQFDKVMDIYFIGKSINSRQIVVAKSQGEVTHIYYMSKTKLKSDLAKFTNNDIYLPGIGLGIIYFPYDKKLGKDQEFISFSAVNKNTFVVDSITSCININQKCEKIMKKKDIIDIIIDDLFMIEQ